MDNIKIIRLQSGEDVMANVVESEGQEYFVLQNPMTVMFKRLINGRAVMLMLPWLPVEIINDNSATIYSNDILSFLDPKNSLIDYYTRAIDDLYSKMQEESDDIESALSSEMDASELMSEEELDEETSFEEVLERGINKVSNKKLLH